jgi:DNA polymerase-3 subunit delta'
MASKKNNNQNIDIIIELIELVISRLAYSGIGKDFDEIITNEKNILAKICFNLNQSQKWASLLGELRKKINYGLKVNIDPGTLVLDMVLKMNKTARD